MKKTLYIAAFGILVSAGSLQAQQAAAPKKAPAPPQKSQVQAATGRIAPAAPVAARRAAAAGAPRAAAAPALRTAIGPVRAVQPPAGPRKAKKADTE